MFRSWVSMSNGACMWFAEVGLESTRWKHQIIKMVTDPTELSMKIQPVVVIEQTLPVKSLCQ